MIARVLCATTQSEQAAMTMAALWGEQVGRFERVELRLPPERRRLPSSPLQPGATVYVAEAHGGRWLHVRIDYREYSIPSGWPGAS